jgi:hypothetical protein
MPAKFALDFPRLQPIVARCDRILSVLEENMTARGRNQHDMPEVPAADFVDSLCETWSSLNYAAYHLAYLRVYLQTAALQTDAEELRQQDQAIRECTQID